jgi:hypothetical protein
LQNAARKGTTKRAGEESHMKSTLMLVGVSALLASFACGCAVETGADEGTPTATKAAPANEKTDSTESPIIYGNPPGYNPPGYNPLAPGLNPPGYNPPGMGVGFGYGYPGVGVGYPGLGWGGMNLNGGFNNVGPY